MSQLSRTCLELILSEFAVDTTNFAYFKSRARTSFICNR